jgi:hypothetical protein
VYEKCEFKKKKVPWAQTTLDMSFGPLLVFVWPALAFVGHCWPLFGLWWPVGVEMGGFNDVGVEMRRWGVETCGWEPKHVVEHLWPKQCQMCRLGSLLLSPPPKTSLCF